MYSAYEVVGIEKRDLLKSRVDDARDEQKEAGESFKDALERFKGLYSFDGGNLEKQYNKVKSSYDDAAGDAENVRESIKKMEVVAGDLFDEWEKEASKIETSSLRAKSRELLADTRKRYSSLHSSLKKSEARMDPVLAKLNDQVLYLKHNLNAKAIGSLKGEADNIQKDIEKLLGDMNASIAEADKFIAELR
jgi:ElaB/YqjD/DUF883 family membrane-anchored ribosome-binding protein